MKELEPHEQIEKCKVDYRVSNSSGPGKNQNSHGLPTIAKMVLLVVLCLQNAVYTMLRRYR